MQGKGRCCWVCLAYRAETHRRAKTLANLGHSVIQVVTLATLRRLHQITNANNNCALNYFDYKAKLFALPDHCVHTFTAYDDRKVSLHHSDSFSSRSGPIPYVPSRALQVRSPFHQTTLAHCDELFPNMLGYRSILTPLT